MKSPLFKNRRPILAFLLLGGTLLFAQTPNAPITNFKLPLFNDAGYRTGYLRGDQGIYINSSEVRILGMVLNQYSGDERDIVTGTMESPEAMFRFDKNRKSTASGPGAISLENDTFRLTGEDWIWQERNNQLIINKKVKIVIFDEIGNVIK